MASLNEMNTLLNNTIHKYIQTIEIGGDSNTYYPVTIEIKGEYNQNYYSNDVFITRTLEMKCYPSYPNCHRDGTSSLSLNIVFRNRGWDGGCNDIKVMKCEEPYSKHLGKIETSSMEFQGIIVWLRGGGTEYQISSKYPIYDCKVYYSRSNISYSVNYPQYVEPLTDPPDLITILKRDIDYSKIAVTNLITRDVYCNYVTCDNTIRGSKIYNAVWNDYAELFERGEETEPGDIICLDTTSTKEQYIKADSSSKRVIGVHSDTYGHLIGGEELDNYEDNFKKFIPIGLAGRVNVKVKGKVDIGDYIVPSDEKGIGRVYNKDIDDRDMIIGYLVEKDYREDVRRLKMFINKK